jgi:hypothetical protein
VALLLFLAAVGVVVAGVRARRVDAVLRGGFEWIDAGRLQ